MKQVNPTKTLSHLAREAILMVLPDAPEGLAYVVIGQYVWGKGPTAREAYENAVEHGMGSPYTIHLVNKEATVSEINGTLYYNQETPGIRINIATFK